MNFRIKNSFVVRVHSANLLQTCFLLSVVVCTQPAFAQKSASVENLSVHHAKEDDEDLNSDFPIVHTGNDVADEKINSLLQTRFFGHLLDEKTTLDVRRNFRATGDQVYAYDTQISERFIGITIKKYHVNNSMSLNGYDETFPFLFDPRTGDQFSPSAFFSDEGVLRFLGKAFHGFRESYNKTMDRYIDGFSKLKPAAQKEQCNCDCEGMLQDVFRNNRVTFQFSKEGVSLSMDACNWQNPGPHDVYSCSIPINEVRPWLSDFGKYMIDNGAFAALPRQPRLLLQATLGGNIHATMVLQVKPDNQVSGYEIYNRIGDIINLRGTVNGTHYTFDELSPEGLPIATFSASRHDTTMTGTWIKGDKSRSLPFAANQYP